jgi:8-oxo-dGTP pyrophosphatase MutT (NUDIX family)
MRLPIQIEAILYKRTNGKIQYLLLKTIPRRGEFWQPITGGLEEGETKREGLQREIHEETEIQNIVKIIGNVHYFEFQSSKLTEYVFGVEVASDETVFLDGKEHSEYRWCSFEEALTLLKWKENQTALEKLNEILRSRDVPT